MGRPVPRFSKRSKLSTDTPSRQFIQSLALSSDSPHNAESLPRNGRHLIVARPYPFMPPPVRTRAAFNDSQTEERSAESSVNETRSTTSSEQAGGFLPGNGVLIIPPWRRHDSAYASPSFDRFIPVLGVSANSFYRLGAQRRASISADSNEHPTSSTNVHNGQTSEENEDEMPEEYRQALRMIVANIIMGDAVTQNMQNNRNDEND